jgi:choline dehydrogenase-like flavoprotein
VLAHGADQAAPEMLGVSRRTPPARPDPELDVTSSTWWPAVSRADAVVVGSGAGGAMVARSLARRGLDVVIVEEGRRWSVEEFRTRHPLARYAELYRDGGTTIAIGRPPIVLPVGRGVGGTTLVNSGTCFRPPDRVQRLWRDDWGVSLADPDEFDRHLTDVEQTIRVAPVPLDVMGNNGRLLLEASDRLGWQARPLDRNAPGCTGSCQCAIGCPNNAKFGVHLSVLPDACGHGARIVTDARVQRIDVGGGRARGVVGRRPDGSRFEIHAPIVVVACGATESPGLVRRSRLGDHPEVGRNLTIHPALGMAGRFAEPVVAWNGVLQSSTVEQFHEDEGIIIEATSTPPGMGSMILPGFGAPLLREIEQADHLAVLGAMIADTPVGWVRSRGGHTIIRYDLDRGDGIRLLGALRRMGQALFAAGAMEVLTGIPGAAPARSEDELDTVLSTTDPRDLHLAAFHPAGTLRAGSDPQRCPVDETGRLRGVEGVWVADGSVLPTCPEVNPQVSIMAMALAIAESIAATGGREARGVT